MIGEPRLRVFGILLMGAAGACLAYGAAAIVLPVWAERAWPYLLMIGASIPWLAIGVLDARLYRDNEDSLREQRNANTKITRVVALEREARLVPVAPVETPPDTRQDWTFSVETFLYAGDVGGFSIRRMAGIVGSDTWAQLTTMLSDAGWLAKAPGRGYVWADGYGIERAMHELRAERLPFPTGPAPVVNAPVNNATQRNTPRRATTVVIDA